MSPSERYPHREVTKREKRQVWAGNLLHESRLEEKHTIQMPSQ